MDFSTVINTLNSLSGAVDAIIGLLPKLVALSAALAAFLPLPAPGDGFYAQAHKWINALAFNFRNAQNAKESENG